MYVFAFALLLLALLASLGGGGLALLQLWQGREDSLRIVEKAHVVISGALLIASAILLHALFWFDFQVQYVASYTDRILPVFYRLTAFWAGQPGSMLFWALAVGVSGSLFACTRAFKKLSGSTRLWYWTFFYAIMGFFALILTSWSNPFMLQSPAPADGSGLNPLLQNPGMIIHPPLLFLGYGGFTIPACLALAQALSGQASVEGAWYRISRPAIILAWLFLTSGIVLGAQKFAQKFSAFKVLQSFVPRDLFFFDDFFQRLFQLCGGAYRGLAGEHGLARCRGGAGIGGADSVRRLDKEDIRGKSCAFASHLQHDRGHALTDAGSAAAQMYLAFLNGGDAASGIEKAHAHAGIFEAGGNAGVLRLVKGFLDGLKAFHHSGTGVGYLSVGQGLPRPHGIAVADFPGGNTRFFGQERQDAFHTEGGLGNAEAAKRSRRGIVGVHGAAAHLEILKVVRPARMGAGALQNRPPQRGEGTGIGQDVEIRALDDAVFVTAKGYVDLHSVPLGVEIQAFLPGEFDLHGLFYNPRGQGRMVLHAHVFLAAETAAHQHGVYVRLLVRQVEHVGQFVLFVIDALRAGIDQDAVLAFGHANGAFRLHKGVVRGGQDKALPDHMP